MIKPFRPASVLPVALGIACPALAGLDLSVHESGIVPAVTAHAHENRVAVRKGDDRRLDLVRWTLNLLIDAEELGIDSANVERARELAQEEETRQLLDLDGKSAGLLGIAPGWGLRAIKRVGNYAEAFERNLGAQSPLKIKRGMNALGRDGGLLYAPPAR